MSPKETKPGRRKRIIGWSVFLLLLVLLGFFLARLLPPQPWSSFEIPRKNNHQLQLVSNNDGASLVTWSYPPYWTAPHRGPIQVWDTNTGRCRHQYLDRIDLSRAFVFSPSHRFLAIHDANGFLHLVDFDGNRERKIPGAAHHFNELVFSPAEQFLLVLDKNKGGNSYLIETETGVIKKKIKEIVEFHAFSAKDEVFVFATHERETGICDLQSRRPFQFLKNTKAVALAPDGRHLLAWKDQKGAHLKGILWDISAGKPLPGFEIEYLFEQGLLFSPDSKILALANEGKEVIFWDVLGRKQLGKPIPVPFFFIRKAAFSPDSKLLLLTGRDKLLVLDLQGIRWQKKIDWHELLITPDSRFLVASINFAGRLPKRQYEVIDLFSGATRTTIKVDPFWSAELFGNGKYLQCSKVMIKNQIFSPSYCGGPEIPTSKNK